MDIYFERASWIWGLSMIALSIAVHAMGLVIIALVLARMKGRLESVSLRDVICTMQSRSWLARSRRSDCCWRFYTG
jgi:hypothetical protein